ncbi:hypothetical protein [Deefgea sp. CFH1-16]|nr:hypothetical protein [Deefgea sp. CFH1-16]MBM5573448.1 hypothetical protein [Deefgea sp. CFH1-16]
MTHQFIFERAGSVQPVSMAAADITISPVPMNKVIDVAGKKNWVFII